LILIRGDTLIPIDDIWNSKLQYPAALAIPVFERNLGYCEAHLFEPAYVSFG
jgi:hypothetical protein